jgi:hypothetical protein
MQNDESGTVKPCSGFATRVTAIGFQILPCSRWPSAHRYPIATLRPSIKPPRASGHDETATRHLRECRYRDQFRCILAKVVGIASPPAMVNLNIATIEATRRDPCIFDSGYRRISAGDPHRPIGERFNNNNDHDVK